MIQIVDVQEELGLDDYGALAHLSLAVHELRSEAEQLVPLLEGRKVWMINSTPKGGGVAEMLPKMIALLRELGVEVEWAVIGSERCEFFAFTKKIHNMIHGFGDGSLSPDEVTLYEDVSRENADELERRIGPEDILVVHDPQPLAAGAMIKGELGVSAIWRCHIGLDDRTEITRAAWRFLKPYALTYDHAVFSAPEYIPSFLAGQASVIHPGIDPLSHKNRQLSPHKLVGVLCNSSLAAEHEPVLTPKWKHPAKRLFPEGGWEPACNGREEIGLVYRPIVAQISRWDGLKGYGPLLEAFVRLKARQGDGHVDERHRRRLGLVRLVLGGPDPAAVADDPEGQEILEELTRRYLELEPELQADVAIVTLPLDSRKENALMVNAIQQCASVVVQNSLQEGFGLTVTEAMWKRVPVVGSAACGIRQQIRDGLDGRLVEEPEDVNALADVLDEMLADPAMRDLMARSAQRRVHEEFLIFTQLRQWLRMLVSYSRP